MFGKVRNSYHDTESFNLFRFANKKPGRGAGTFAGQHYKSKYIRQLY